MEKLGTSNTNMSRLEKLSGIISSWEECSYQKIEEVSTTEKGLDIELYTTLILQKELYKQIGEERSSDNNKNISYENKYSKYRKKRKNRNKNKKKNAK